MHPIRWRPDAFAVLAMLLGAVGVGWRIVLGFLVTPPTNSDEATIGLAALHIAQGRELPIFFYGQHYMGTIEAYLAAPLVAVFGPTVWALRIPMLLLYVTFLVLMFVLVRRVFSAGLAVLTVGLLALGSDRMVRNQLIAGGGYPESSPMVAGLLLLTFVLITRAQTKWYAFAGWGVLFGLIVWNHWLPAPYLVGALLLLVAFRVFTWPMALVTTAGAALGALPLIIDNAISQWSDNSVAVFLFLNSAGRDAPLMERVIDGAWYGLPMGMGLCQPSHCAPWSLWWAPVVISLLFVALIVAVRGVRRRGRSAADGGAYVSNDRAKHAMRLVLAAAGLLSLLSYVRSPASADAPMESARYLSMLALSLPAALWPLWQLGLSAREPVGAGVGGTRERRWAYLALAPIVALAATMLAASVSVIDRVPYYQWMDTEQRAVIAALDDAGVTYVYGEYWTCNWISYLTSERIVCGVVNEELNAGLNRYGGFWRPDSQAVLAQVGTPLDAELARRLPGVVPKVVGSFHLYPPAPAPIT